MMKKILITLLIILTSQSVLANICQENSDIAKQYDSISVKDCQDKTNLIRVQKSGKVGLVDMSGKVMLAPTYDYISDFNIKETEKMFVNNDGKWGVIDKQGNVLIPLQYDFILPIDNSPLHIVQKNAEPLPAWSDMDLNEKDLMLAMLLLVQQMSMEIYAQVYQAKFGLIDANNQLILPMEYDSVDEMDKDFITVKKDGKRLLIDKLGDVLKD